MMMIPGNDLSELSGKQIVQQMRLWKDHARAQQNADAKNRAMMVYHNYSEALQRRIWEYGRPRGLK